MFLRDDLEAAKQQLISLGATHVFTYDDLSDKSRVAEIKSLIGSKVMRL
jgi:mitochondrial enoyl-[acyl-carrier protein] reductase / trans-2-enoyl-CoA reductase